MFRKIILSVLMFSFIILASNVQYPAFNIWGAGINAGLL